jgi:dihydroneopterin aldolase
MAIIALEGIRLHARHGYYPEEEILGTEFIIDVYVETDTNEAAKSDELIHTVNYETIYLICSERDEKHEQPD